MIDIISQPLGVEDYTDPAVPPIPLSECFNFCLQPDVADVFTTVGVKPSIVFVVPFSCSVPANGTGFVIWGYDFTIDSTTPFSSSSFKVEALGLNTILNLANMLLSNLFFKRSGHFLPVQIVGSAFHLTWQWNECREQINFTGDNMNLSVFTSIGGSATATNGTSPVPVEAYRIIANVVRYQDSTADFYDLSALVGMEAEKLCDETGVVCIDANPDISADLYTIFPGLSYTSFVSAIDNGRSMMRFYSLQFGWTYRENCIAKSGTITRGDKILAINAAFDIDDPYQMRRYWYNHPDGFPPDQFVPDFLTTQPKTIPLCIDSYKWLWLLNNFRDDYSDYSLLANFYLYDASGNLIDTAQEVVNDPLTMGHEPYQAVCFNASPKHIVELGFSLNDVAYYEVQVLGVETADNDVVLFNASEYLRFEICKNCCSDETDIYFLSPTGSIDTILVRVDSVETLQSGGEEIRVNIPCGTNRGDRATNGGRSLVATRVYQKMTFSIQIPPSADWEKWVKHLRQSPQRWVRVRDEGGAYIAKKIIFEAGAITQQQTGTGVIVEMTGYLRDVPTQGMNEKRL